MQMRFAMTEQITTATEKPTPTIETVQVEKVADVTAS
jgi:hypothetical protein